MEHSEDTGESGLLIFPVMRPTGSGSSRLLSSIKSDCHCAYHQPWEINFWIKVFPEWVSFPHHCEVQNYKSNHHKSGTICTRWTWWQRNRLFLIVLKHSSPQPAGEAALQCRYHGSSQVSSHSSNATVSPSQGTLPCHLVHRRNSKARGETRRQVLRVRNSGFLLWCIQKARGRVLRMREHWELVQASSSVPHKLPFNRKAASILGWKRSPVTLQHLYALGLGRGGKTSIWPHGLWSLPSKTRIKQ